MDFWQTAVRLLVGTGVTIAAVAQAPPPVPTAVVRSSAVAGFVGGVPSAPIAGHPYSAEQVTEHTQILGDGTRISQTSQTSLMYRDSEGRTRTERMFPPPPGGAVMARHSFIEIYDPVAGCRYLLNEQSHSAQKIPFPPAMRAGSNVQPSVWFSSNSMAAAPQAPSQAMRMPSTGSISMGGMISAVAPPPSANSRGRP